MIKLTDTGVTGMPLIPEGKVFEAKKLLPEVAEIVLSDLMKAHHYADKALRVAILADQMKIAEQIATISVSVAVNIKMLQHILREQK